MKILVKRCGIEAANSTLSMIYINGVFCCYGLEDRVRDLKIAGETAIPAGTYKLAFRKLGAMHADYSRRFPEFHLGMIELQQVPNYKYVYLHIGNNFGDTAGCILVGEEMKFVDEDYVLRRSKSAYKRLYRMLIPAIQSGQAVLEIG